MGNNNQIITKLINNVTTPYPIHWLIGYFDKDDSSFELIQPVCEHDFEVVKFPDEEDEGKEGEMTKQIKKSMETGLLLITPMQSECTVRLTCAS